MLHATTSSTVWNWSLTNIIFIHCYLIIYSLYLEICTRFLLCCGYTLTDFPITIRLTSLALAQSNDCPSASKATLMNLDKYFMRIHYERLHNHNKAKHNKAVCIFLGIYCMFLTHWGRDKMDVILQTIFSSAFYWMEMYELRLKIHWSLLLRVQLTIFQHWFR